MRKLIPHQGGKVVAYRSLDGRIVTADMYRNIIKRELRIQWEENDDNCKGAFNTFDDYYNFAVLRLVNDFEPLQYEEV